MSRSPSREGRSSPSSARTGRGRAPPCGRSPASSVPPPGSIVHDGKSIAGLPSHRIARLGIAHVPEGRGVFANMSVRENLEMGAYARSSRKEVEESFERVFGLFPRLARARGPARRDPVRGGAADAGHREGARPAARPAPSRRAVHGVVPPAGGRDLPDDRGDQQGGDDDPPRRAERLHGPLHRRPRLRPRDGGDRSSKGRRPICWRIRRSGPPTWGTIRDESFPPVDIESDRGQNCNIVFHFIARPAHGGASCRTR